MPARKVVIESKDSLARKAAGKSRNTDHADIRAMQFEGAAVKVDRYGLDRIERDIRPLMGSTITVPVTVSGVRVGIYVCTSAFETSHSVAEQDAAVKAVAMFVANALECREGNQRT